MQIFSENKVTDIKAFITDLNTGWNYGFSQSAPNRSTYDDLLGAGKLGIIEDSSIRALISFYYREYERQHTRIDERETSYPALVYQYLPKFGNFDGRKMKWYPDFNPTEEEALQLAKSLLDSPIRAHVNAEYNFGDFTIVMTRNVHRKAQELKEALLAYQQEIQN